MTFVGLDLNATCARAVSGPEGIPCLALLLDGDQGELPMAVSIEGRRPEVGRPGAALCRQYPHLACVDLLPRLGTPHTWGTKRRRLDAAKALALIFEQLRASLAGATAVALAMPGYLSFAQVQLVQQLARKARMPMTGSVSAALALGLAAHAEQALSGPVLVVDADDHALSWSLVRFSPEQVQILATKAFVHLGLRAWKGRLLDTIADSCIHQSRRDPRDSGSAEQLLYDQLDDVLLVSGQNKPVEVVIRASNWCQNLILQPQQIKAFCGGLVQEASEECQIALAQAPEEFRGAVLVSAAAGRLPGLIGALRSETPESVPVVQLAPDAAARGAHSLAARFQRGEIPSGHLEGPVRLSAKEPKSSHLWSIQR